MNALFLMHYGVPGQKWGVKHGPPYPIDRTGDVRIEKGTELHKTVLGKKLKKLDSDRGTYVYDHNDLHDRGVYKGGFASSTSSWNKKLYDVTFKASQDLILPSQKTKVDTFLKMCREEPMRKYMDVMRGQYAQKSLAKVIKKWDELDQNEQTRLNRDYRIFTATPNFNSGFHKAFINELSKQGYNAMIDDFDANRYYAAHNPLYVFSQTSLELSGKQKRIWGKEIGENLNRVKRYGKGW